MWSKNFFFITIVLFFMNIDKSFASDNITLKCRNYISDVMCKVPAKILLNDTVEVLSITHDRSLRQSELEKAKVVVISRELLIERLPHKIGVHFNSLEKFIANLLGLKTIARDEFLNMTLVNTLNLADNKLKNIPFDAFFDLLNLKVLYLDGNELTKFHVAMLSRSINLTMFSAQNNELEALEENCFVENQKLESILLYHNKLTKVNVNFTSLPNLRQVDLRKNTEICTKCQPKFLADRKLREKNFVACATHKYIDTKKYQENFQNCTIESLNKNETFAKIFENCTTDLLNERSKIDKTFNEKLHNKNVPFIKKAKEFGDYISNRMAMENETWIKYENCCESLISEDIEVDNLLKNCTTVKDANKSRVSEEFDRCTFCKPDLGEDELEKCKMQFPDKNLTTFQKYVDKYFNQVDNYYEYE